MSDRPESLFGCARVRTKCAEKNFCWSVMTVYILDKLPDVSGLGPREAGHYTSAKLFPILNISTCIQIKVPNTPISMDIET